MLRPETRLFSFAVVGDTHVKPETGDQSAPWKVNERATGRARFIAREIARYDPRFVIHLGDLVHPVPELPTFDAAVALTHDVFRQHHNRMHVLPGNHDIGDKPNRAMPAKGVRESWIAIHEKNFGPSYRFFDQDGVRVVTLNTPVLNSGLPMEAAQRAWLETTLASAGDLRVFVFLHYPLFVRAPDEPSTYDNVDEPARSDLLDLFRRHQVEAVFAGHVHNIFYHRLAGTEYYVLPATSFVRQDYSEMFRIEAAAENGRDDAEKLGFVMVDVHADGHAVHILRSYGRELGAAESLAPAAPRTTDLLPHPKRPGGAPIGVFMRHPWAEIVTLPQNGPMDEFVRKQVRNDYPIAALWRLGVRRARVPLDDLIDPASRRRMADLVAIGHRFTVSGFGVPAGGAADAIVEHADLIDRFECVLPFDAVSDQAEALAAFRARLGRPVLLARVATSADEAKIGSKIELFVAHGFRPDQLPDLEALLPLAIDGIVVRAGLDADLPALCATLDAWARRTGLGVDLHLRIAGNNPAANVTDDAAILAAAVEFYACALAFPRLGLFFDPFMDLDRGYFVRHGLVDRRCNLRPAGLAIEALSTFWGETGAAAELAVDMQGQGRILMLSGAERAGFLILPKPGARLTLDPARWEAFGLAAPPLCVPLDAPWQVSSRIGTQLAAEDGSVPDTFDRPTLLVGTRSKV
ncbi:metallophosphoesterase [Aquabacter spiritensis]|uniref:Calcineurin-like phosphoesterase family protein n=1 Tax=Aquabacter spiritensis TaxID=933073 RepID=A0A4R3M3R3_9HYPH|nr:metallophosphoesterase [Aquabacter spiritensis]TCT07904.1 calcineurin-like phosphoesterase family protein [Aquabacter spiritensis]